MAPVRGRKSVIVMSPGFIMDQEFDPDSGGGGRRQSREHRDVFRRRPRTGSAIGVRVGAVWIAARYPRRRRRERGSVARGGRGRRRWPIRAAASPCRTRTIWRPASAASAASPACITCLVTRPTNPARIESSGASACAWTGRTSRFAPGKGTTPAAYRRIPSARRDDALEVALESPYDITSVPVRAEAYVFGNATRRTPPSCSRSRRICARSR